MYLTRGWGLGTLTVSMRGSGAGSPPKVLGGVVWKIYFDNESHYSGVGRLGLTGRPAKDVRTAAWTRRGRARRRGRRCVTDADRRRAGLRLATLHKIQGRRDGPTGAPFREGTGEAEAATRRRRPLGYTLVKCVLDRQVGRSLTNGRD